ncbi:MAG: serine--tRNA ligase [Candidatus Pelagibacter sp.]|mgnify:FL=1|jgi:seryl-tRNA synthetase|nr:serine--tRNA ligase [Candidatus Pelagibacter sp.]MDP6440336.1 serine--tRNA ligase [Pelagibacteraceae bacterium]
MHNIKEIRSNLENFENRIKQRNSDIDIEVLQNLDNKNRNLIQKKEKLEQEKKIISKSKDSSLFKKSKDLSKEIDNICKEQILIQNNLNEILIKLPNLALEDVPVGKDESSNKVISENGKINDFSFKPKSHYDLGKNLGMIDFELASKTSGSRFVFLKGEIALLERAISNFMIDTHTQNFNYIEISPPLMVTSSTMFGTGQLPKFEEDQFEIKLDSNSEKKFLIPTAEVILTNMVRDKILSFKELPIRLVASTACFRKEAGSYGKDTKGMMRQHQFYKVELVSIVEPNLCLEELDKMTGCAENILQKLELPYRKILLSTGDMGFSAEKTYDLEAWIPSENNYREISSCSSCGSFQAKRMKARYKNKNNETCFVGTLNGSGLAVGRTLIAIMENCQQDDGSIIIPEVLRPYMNGLKLIKVQQY